MIDPHELLPECPLCLNADKVLLRVHAPYDQDDITIHFWHLSSMPVGTCVHAVFCSYHHILLSPLGWSLDIRP